MIVKRCTDAGIGSDQNRENNMHDIEPHWGWRQHYTAEEDMNSPFYGRLYDEFTFSDRIYDHFIHPQWDYIGSETLFVKLLFAEYEDGFAVFELLGEWNDCLHNDIMHFKRNVVDRLLKFGIDKFILIGENVLNFHASDQDYYEEWFDDVGEEGWLAMLNFTPHVMREFCDYNIDQYFLSGGDLYFEDWRSLEPAVFFERVNSKVQRRLM